MSFPIDGGGIDPATAAGVCATRAAWPSPRAAPPCASPTSRSAPTCTAYLTARVGNGGIRLLALDLGDAKVMRRGPGKVGTWAVRVQSTLTAQAGALNAPSVPPGGRLPIGRVDLRIVPVRGGARGRRDDAGPRPGTAAALTGLGVTPSVIPPGTAAAAGLSFPVTGGNCSRRGRRQIATPAASPSTAGATKVELKRFIIEVNARAS